MANLADRHASPERPFCDAVIRVHGDQFNIHKFILSECSKYFRVLFLHHSDPDRKEFEVLGISAAIMKIIIDFAYTGSVTVTDDNVQELLQAADQFIITGIEQACCNFLLERLNSENCISIWQLSNICFCPDLQLKVYRYLLIHFEEVASRNEFQQLSVQELSCILESDDLNVRWEKNVCKAIFKWVSFEPAERQQHFAVLLSKVRLALTSQWFITALMKTEAISGNAECLEIVQRAQKLKTYMSTLKPSLSIFSNQVARPRLPSAILFAIEGFNFSRKKANHIEVYDFCADRWKTMSYCGPHPHTSHGIAYFNGSVYCVGGRNKILPTNMVHRLDLATHTWLEVAPMHQCRDGVSVTVLDGFIYAIGGYNQTFYYCSAERYNPQLNQWHYIGSLHEQRSEASCTSLQNMIYICGGYNGQSCLSTCECYCPLTDQWTKIKSMSCRLIGHGIIAYNNLIYAVGGCTRNVEAYNPRTNSWQAVPSMLFTRSNFGIAVIDDRLFAVGGHSTTDNSVEFYDKFTNLWTVACRMNIPHSSLSCCVVPRLPNVAEYVINRDDLQQIDEEEVLGERSGSA